MELAAKSIVRQIICLRVRPDYAWNDDKAAPRTARVDDDGRPLFSHEVMILPVAAGRPLTCWLRSAHGDNPPTEGDTIAADDLRLSLFNDREGRTRWSFTASMVNKA